MYKRDLKREALKALKQKEKRKLSMEEAIEKAKQIDKLEDKTRKTLTKEQKAIAEYEQMLNYKDREVKINLPTNSEDEWDVKKDDPVEFFDPNLSYELTGYRPITKDKGLDFDPKLFTEAADNYRKYGRYTQLVPGTFAHRQHWTNEFERCKNGVTIGKYTVTGEHYFFLNYYRLLSVFGSENGQEIRSEDFPGFFAKQYEYFHYIDLCRKAGFDICAFKARAVGASEISASNVACAYTFHKDSYNIITAFDEKYVTQTLNKVWQELDFLNTCTEGAFRHVRMKFDTQMKKKASKVDKDKNESGWGSIIEGITSDNPRKLRGARVYNLIFEEAGSHGSLIDTYVQARALVFVGGSYRIGCRTLQGTGGDSSANLAGLRSIFNNPEDYQVLPYKHNYTKSGETTLTGYFIPAYTMWFGTPANPGFDSRGVVDEERAKKYYTDRWEKISNPSLLIKDKAEYCFTPEDAFVLEGENTFNREKLSEQLHNIELHKIIEKPKTCILRYPMNSNEVDRNGEISIEFSPTGKIEIAELPMRDNAGIPFKNLYVIGVDGIDQDTMSSTGQKDVSDFCVVVLRRAFGTQPPKVVAMYKERPKYIKDAFDNALKLAMFYNAKVLVERSKIGVITHFKQYHKQYYLMNQPQSTISSSSRQKRHLTGVTPTKSIIEHQLELIEAYIEENCTEIQFPVLIDELLRYSYANKKKFDTVAAFGIALLADEDMMGKTVRMNNQENKFEHFGYYTDDYGRKKFGTIKTTERVENQFGWFVGLDQMYYRKDL